MCQFKLMKFLRAKLILPSTINNKNIITKNPQASIAKQKGKKRNHNYIDNIERISY